MRAPEERAKKLRPLPTAGWLDAIARSCGQDRADFDTKQALDRQSHIAAEIRAAQADALEEAAEIVQGIGPLTHTAEADFKDQAVATLRTRAAKLREDAR